jgi:hypothetical protein
MAQVKRNLGKGGSHLAQLEALLNAAATDIAALVARVSTGLFENLKLALVNGAAAATNIAISGIATTDLLVQVIELTSGAVSALRGGEASITSAGNIQLSTTNTTGKTLLVLWFDRPATLTATLTASSS